MILEEFIKKVRSIEILSRKIVKKGMGGQYLSSFKGTGMQFREFRNYVYGDDVRHISWTVSARAQDPVIKTFEEERERTLFLLVDVSSSLRKGPWAQKKAEVLALTAGILAHSATEANDKLGLLLFSDKVEKVIRPKKGRTHLLRLIREVLFFQPQGKKTQPTVALEQLDAVLKKQSIVILLSDMEYLPDEYVLRHVRSKHDLLAIGVEEAQEFQIPDVGFFEVETAEWQRPFTLHTHSESLRKHLQKTGQERQERIERFYKKCGVDYLSLSTTQDVPEALMKFFKNRSSRKK